MHDAVDDAPPLSVATTRIVLSPSPRVAAQEYDPVHAPLALVVSLYQLTLAMVPSLSVAATVSVCGELVTVAGQVGEVIDTEGAAFAVGMSSHISTLST